MSVKLFHVESDSYGDIDGDFVLHDVVSVVGYIKCVVKIVNYFLAAITFGRQVSL